LLDGFGTWKASLSNTRVSAAAAAKFRQDGLKHLSRMPAI
jgi:hypothetical protein